MNNDIHRYVALQIEKARRHPEMAVSYANRAFGAIGYYLMLHQEESEVMQSYWEAAKKMFENVWQLEV